jgi:hypothetical protein
MKKKNQDGFIAISIIYSFFILFILVMLVIMYSYMSDRKAANRIKTDIVNEFSLDVPQISINPKGSDDPQTSYSVKISVKDVGNGIDSIKYIWATDQTSVPDTDVENNATITSPTTAGQYYLIIKACDSYSDCQTLISNRFIVK